jgi:hypothetical protein
MYGASTRLLTEFELEDAIDLGCLLLLPLGTANSATTLKAKAEIKKRLQIHFTKSDQPAQLFGARF